MKPLGYGILFGSLALLVWTLLTAYRTIRERSQWELDTTRYFTAEEVARAEAKRDTLWHDSMAVITAGLAKVAERNRMLLVSLRDTISVLNASLAGQPAPVDTSVWLQIQLRRLETLEMALGAAEGEIASLRGAYAAQQLITTRLKLENQRAWSLIDSASAVIRRVPGPCRVPLIPIPCPRLVAGYGVGPAGLGPFAGVAIPLN